MTHLSEQWRQSIAEYHGKPISPMMAIAIKVAGRHHMAVKLLLGREQPKRLWKPRLELILLCRSIGRSFNQIGKFMSNRDHTTIMHYIRMDNGKGRYVRKAERRGR